MAQIGQKLEDYLHCFNAYFTLWKNQNLLVILILLNFSN